MVVVVTPLVVATTPLVVEKRPSPMFSLLMVCLGSVYSLRASMGVDLPDAASPSTRMLNASEDGFAMTEKGVVSTRAVSIYLGKFYDSC